MYRVLFAHHKAMAITVSVSPSMATASSRTKTGGVQEQYRRENEFFYARVAQPDDGTTAAQSIDSAGSSWQHDQKLRCVTMALSLTINAMKARLRHHDDQCYEGKVASP
jgi:hypothetical protein